MDFQQPKNRDENAQVESYLDDLCVPLREMPQEARDEIRQEIGAHLRSLIAMQREPDRVLDSALQQFGDPTEIGRLLALEWENREWDLSGLPWTQRIEKLREALLEENYRNTTLRRRSYWHPLLIASPSLLFLLKGLSQNDIFLLRVLDVAILIMGGLAVMVSWAFAWLDWHNVQMHSRSKLRRVQDALSQIAVGLFALMPLIFQSNFSIEVSFLLISLPVGLMFLKMALTKFEPSHKARFISKSTAIVGGICGVSIIVVTTILNSLDIKEFWIQLPIIWIVIYAIRCLFLGAKSSKRKNVE